MFRVKTYATMLSCGQVLRNLKNITINYSYQVRRHLLKASADCHCAAINASMDRNAKHLVFVYGTLKSGEPNYCIMRSKLDSKDAEFMGKAKTLKKWPLVIASQYNIPFLLKCEGFGHCVKGELYQVSDEALAALDEFENHPDLYERIQEQVTLFDDQKTTQAWIYFLKALRDDFLQLPYWEDYSSKGPHGLEYRTDEDLKDINDVEKQ